MSGERRAESSERRVVRQCKRVFTLSHKPGCVVVLRQQVSQPYYYIVGFVAHGRMGCRTWISRTACEREDTALASVGSVS